MIAMNSLGKLLILFGLMLIVVGLIFIVAGRMPWFGRLPGDIYVQKKNYTIFFPITTSIIISVILSILLILFKRR